MNEKKSNDTLVDDIFGTLKGVPEVPEALLDESLADLKEVLKYRLTERQPDSKLRMSNFGTKCLRKLWYIKNKPEEAEELEPHTRFKFLYGDLLEWVVLLLAKVAGHKVEGQQTTLKVGNIEGHRDAIINGELVDVKSASKFGFQKFKSGTVPEGDTFGYMDQLSLYHHASLPEGVDPDKASFLAVEKESGHIVLDTYKMYPRDWETEVRKKSEIVNSETPPERSFKPQPYGKSGNMTLGVECSYCPWKRVCFPGLKAYSYSGKPVFFTEIVREPDVPRLF